MSAEVDQEAPRADDERPNSGLREGNITHADVNAALRAHHKTVIFGQQTRLRDGVLLDDEKLERFHAGHDLVKFFYGGVRQLPEYLLDALLDWGISVTLVKSDDLLVFRHVREHQSFHVGRTRKTIYMPEKAIEEAADKGYDYWAISEVMIQEAWSLLDYHLLIELTRRAQQHFQRHYTLSHAFVRDQLMALNKHRKFSDAEPDNEFNEFFNHYAEQFYALDRDAAIGADPFVLVDSFFDEVLQRKWASNKRFEISRDLQYPTYYDIDRDIVHPTAFHIAEQRGVSIEPETVDEILHDMQDAVRFKVGMQGKTDTFLDMLIELGEPGIGGFLTLAWDEGEYFGGGYYPAVELKKKLQIWSTSPPDGQSGSISQDFARLLAKREGEQLDDLYRDFARIPFRQKRFLVLKLADLAGTSDIHQLSFEIGNATLYTNEDEGLLKGLADIIYDRYLQIDRDQADIENYLMGQLLKKLDRHPRYREVYVPQYEQLTGGRGLLLGEDIRPQVEALAGLIPDKPLRLSFDPQRLRSRLHRFEQLREENPNSTELLRLLAGIFLRLDRSDNYDELVGKVRGLAEYAWPVCAEIVEQVGEKDRARADILRVARGLLREKGQSGGRDAGEKEWQWPSLVQSLYKVLGVEGAGHRDQALYWYVRQERKNKGDVLRGIEARGGEVPEAHRAIIALLFLGQAETPS
ncbi:MAG TPA: hypothetical protein EYG11_18405 [Candidatus Latescibacteria bacterium]|nr:hypothetical protein [Candidatus Latescibacterota bacterium]